MGIVSRLTSRVNHHKRQPLSFGQVVWPPTCSQPGLRGGHHVGVLPRRGPSSGPPTRSQRGARRPHAFSWTIFPLDKTILLGYAVGFYYGGTLLSLSKSPSRTAAFRAAHRQARPSCGPRTRRGQANLRLNAPRQGERSQGGEDFAFGVFSAPPGGVERAVRAWLTPDLARHPKSASYPELATEADMPGRERLRRTGALLRRKKRIPFFDDQSRNVIEKTGPSKTRLAESGNLAENTALSR